MTTFYSHDNKPRNFEYQHTKPGIPLELKGNSKKTNISHGSENRQGYNIITHNQARPPSSNLPDSRRTIFPDYNVDILRLLKR